MENLEAKLNVKIDYDNFVKGEKVFEDPDFPAVTQSVIADGELYTGDKSLITWVRYKSLMASEGEKLVAKFGPNDVLQGELNDSAFLSCVSALAEFVGRTDSLFITKQLNNVGCYMLAGYIMGKRYKIIMDDKLPVSTTNGQLLFAKQSGSETWPLLLEKAWAKINGSYYRTKDTDEADALAFLTGAPCEKVYSAQVKEEDFGKRLAEVDSKNYIMIGRCDSSLDGKLYTDAGLFKGFHYSLISVSMVNYNDKDTYVLRLRNPVGQYEWKGAWSDKWEGWNKKLRSKLKAPDTDDGFFYMEISDYMKFFCVTSICQWVKGYTSQAVIINKNAACIKFEVMENVNGFVGVCPFILSTLKDAKNIKERPVMSVMIAKCEKDKLEYIGCTGSTWYEGHLELKLMQGTYLAFCTSSFPAGAPTTFSFHTYLDTKDIIFEEKPFDKEAFAQLYKDYAKKLPGDDSPDNRGLRICKACNPKLGLNLRYFENRSANELKVQIIYCYNDLSFLYPATGDPRLCQLTLKPKESAITLASMKEDNNYNDKYKCAIRVNESSPAPPAPPAPPAKAPIAKPTPAAATPPVKPIAVPAAPVNYSPPPRVLFDVPDQSDSQQNQYVTPPPPQPQYQPQYQPQPQATMEPVKQNEEDEEEQCGGLLSHCGTCLYYMCCCYLCFGKTTVAVENSRVCRNGHELILSNFEYPEGKYGCDKCGNGGFCREGRWHCDACTYDVCPNCYPVPRSAN